MAVQVHSPRGICARPALQAAPPSGSAQSELAARGLALWVTPEPGTTIDPDVLARAARLLLERALKFAPEAEVHWPAAGAATSAVAKSPAGLPPIAGEVSRVAVDLAAEQVLLDGTEVNLTGVEFKVLRYLVENCSRPISREELQHFLESFESPGASARSIDVYVGRVRRKLGNARHAVATVRGGGYQFVPGVCATVRGPAEYCI